MDLLVPFSPATLVLLAVGRSPRIRRSQVQVLPNTPLKDLQKAGKRKPPVATSDHSQLRQPGFREGWTSGHLGGYRTKNAGVATPRPLLLEGTLTKSST